MNGEVGLQAKTLSLSAGLESVCLECICYIYYLSCHSFYLDSRHVRTAVQSGHPLPPIVRVRIRVSPMPDLRTLRMIVHTAHHSSIRADIITAITVSYLYRIDLCVNDSFWSIFDTIHRNPIEMDPPNHTGTLLPGLRRPRRGLELSQTSLSRDAEERVRILNPV